MKPGERINVIREVVDALAEQDWPTVDLILEQFGFTTFYEWDGDLRSYAIAVVKIGSGESLLATGLPLSRPSRRSAPRRRAGR
jgi:hypothetical protein